MAGKTRFKQLLKPGRIGKIKLKNRFIKTCGGAEDIGARNRFFLESIARGGTGLIIWGDVAVEYPGGVTIPNAQRHLQDETNLEAMRLIADSVHRYDRPVFMQIFHTGPQAVLKNGLQAVSSSSIDENEHAELLIRNTPHALTIPEIKEIVGKFVRTAELAKQAGFDGVEVNAARMNLINSFLSRVWNRRKDEYGCQNMENRTRFLVEIVHAIKKALGKDFPVITLINGMEIKIRNGTTVKEAQEIARILEKAGVDAIHVRAFGYHGFDGLDASPKGAYYSDNTKPLPPELDWSRGGKAALSPLSAAIKEVVSIPVITVGALEDPEIAEDVLEQGKADFIGICKGLMADPDIPYKVSKGRPEDIVLCTDCGDCARILFSMTGGTEPVVIRCRVNGALGADKDYQIKPAEKKKRVVVVGGGPSGMEAARVAAMRGHQVTLFEKENRLGGLLPFVAMIRGRDVDYDVMIIADRLKNQITKLGVDIRLGEKFNPSMVSTLTPDVIILAAGGVRTVPAIPIIKHNTAGVDDLYLQIKNDLDMIPPADLRKMGYYWKSIGKNVVILGGTIAGVGLAEYLTERGINVTIVDEGDIYKTGSRKEHKVTKFPCATYGAVTETGMTFITKEGDTKNLEADKTIIATSPVPNIDLYKAFEGRAPEVYLVGMEDREPSTIMNAIGNAFRLAQEI
ncbi:MAG: FAD-dependent oxidoreductase [Deltaproteobacteria bacterium]|nr:FAD-dependent oxidoreductase [Deltaproteobacteria bacterium]